MKQTLLALPALLLAFSPSALAAGPADAKKACVAASTEGQTARDDGKLMDARKSFLSCARDECPAVVRKSCAQWLTDVEDRIPSAVIRVLDAQGGDVTDVEVTIDGQAISLDGRALTLEAGQHVAALKAADGTTTEHKFLLAEHEKSRIISIQLAGPKDEAKAGGSEDHGGESKPAAPASKASGTPTGAYVLGGVGILALGSFTYFGLTAKGQLNKLKASGTGCSPNCTDAQTKPGRTDALIADISLGVGAAALIGAVTWALLAPSSSKPETARITVVPTSNGAYASFSGSY